MVTNKQ